MAGIPTHGSFTPLKASDMILQNRIEGWFWQELLFHHDQRGFFQAAGPSSKPTTQLVSSLKPIEQILTHLALANTLVLLSKGIPEVMEAWRIKNFLDAVGCKILIYCSRVGRGLSICMTCLLSVFQAITISPGTSFWATLKAKAPMCITPSCLLFWILSLSLDVPSLLYITGPKNKTNTRNIFNLIYCSSVSLPSGVTHGLSTVFILWDLIFVELMSAASGYMVCVLRRHHRLVHHLHGSSHSPRVMPEVSAAKRVIALVTLYVLLYGNNTITLNALLNNKIDSPLLLNVHMTLSLFFPTVSPFLIINTNKRSFAG
ncbi:vomeronasal type-1 receptor 4-like [Tachyglossus aculeatus]|uniref:vomeronasal type-1 receptor 4-like n=1 Tax=Tachyglossus aculeatus TaxID=9261 RepID=UPI0018F651EA|nr:vomeronasal type-1 receptor 4-like [Tachyglossus aculeatus]